MDQTVSEPEMIAEPEVEPEPIEEAVMEQEESSQSIMDLIHANRENSDSDHLTYLVTKTCINWMKHIILLKLMKN